MVGELITNGRLVSEYKNKLELCFACSITLYEFDTSHGF